MPQLRAPVQHLRPVPLRLAPDPPEADPPLHRDRALHRPVAAPGPHRAHAARGERGAGPAGDVVPRHGDRAAAAQPSQHRRSLLSSQLLRRAAAKRHPHRLLTLCHRASQTSRARG